MLHIQILVCVQANVVTHVQASSHVCMSVHPCPCISLLISVCATCVSQACCVELVANFYRTIYAKSQLL